jgi:hypothetical protein
MQLQSKDGGCRKPQCKDCKMCQNCAESRCLACRGGNPHHRLSIYEQIALFNSLNPNLSQGACLCENDSEE